MVVLHLGREATKLVDESSGQFHQHFYERICAKRVQNLNVSTKKLRL
jgi:hypothetical protein